MALGQTSLIATFAKAYWEFFCGTKFTWKHYCFTGGRKKKLGLMKWTCWKDITSLFVMKPRCKELWKKKVLSAYSRQYWEEIMSCAPVSGWTEMKYL